MDFKTKPFRHQLESFEVAKDRPYFALFLEPGLGKTKISLDIITHSRLKTLVVCPNTIVDNWADEAKIHSDLRCVTLTGSKQHRISLLQQQPPANLYVINYESTRVLTEELIKADFRFLILDESTCVKNHKSLQSKACFKLSQHINKKLLLTGTPIMNNLLDIFAQYRILDTGIFGVSFYRFRARYAVMGGYMNYQVVRWINVPDFKRRVFSCAIRKTKDECLDLPSKLYQVIKLDLPEEQRKVYDKLKDEFIAEFKDVVITAPQVLTRLMRFSQITAGFTKDVEGVEHGFKKNPKIDWLLEFIESLEADRKVVVFCRFIHEIRTLEAVLLDKGIGCTCVFGEVTDRIERVHKFNDDPTVKVFIGQIQTTGLGINLTSGTYVIFFTNSYSYGERIQCEDRCHRIGQTKNVTYIDLLYRNTIDIAIHLTLKRKESLSNLVIGDIVKMI